MEVRKQGKGRSQNQRLKLLYLLAFEGGKMKHFPVDKMDEIDLTC